MIKKILLISSALIFAFGVLGTSVIRTSASTASKNYKVTLLESTSAGKTATDTAIQKVDYFLAYPGILPDHFLYPLKMIRDRITLFFTVDSLRKIDILLLFSDKRIGAAKALMEKGKANLAITTATKAEKYLERAVNQERVAREGGKNTSGQQDKLLKATFKHEEVLLEIEANIGEASSEIKNILKYPQWAREKVLQASKK